MTSCAIVPLMRFLLGLAIFIGGCSEKNQDAPAAPAVATRPAAKEGEAKPAPTAAGAPTKEAAIEHLRKVLAALEAKDWEKVAGYFAVSAGVVPPSHPDDLQRAYELKFRAYLEQRNVSAKGIDVLAARGKWGKLSDLFNPELAAHFAQKFGVPADQLWAFSVEGVSPNRSPLLVGFHHDGRELHLIRLEAVGELE